MMSEVILTKDEAECLYDFLEIHLIDDIREDLDIDNMTWLAHIMNIWQKCREVTKNDSNL